MSERPGHTMQSDEEEKREENEPRRNTKTLQVKKAENQNCGGVEFSGRRPFGRAYDQWKGFGGPKGFILCRAFDIQSPLFVGWSRVRDECSLLSFGHNFLQHGGDVFMSLFDRVVQGGFAFLIFEVGLGAFEE